jgi:hypothetical protein
MTQTFVLIVGLLLFGSIPEFFGITLSLVNHLDDSKDLIFRRNHWVAKNSSSPKASNLKQCCVLRYGVADWAQSKQ